MSHNLIHQRFSSKQGLWRAAVDRAFGRQVAGLATAFDPTLTDPLDQLNLTIRRFLVYSAEHPELLGLMNIEGRVDGERLDYIYNHYVAPALAPLGRLLEHLIAEERIRPISLRSLLFLIGHGAAAPFTLTEDQRRIRASLRRLTPRRGADGGDRLPPPRRSTGRDVSNPGKTATFAGPS